MRTLSNLDAIASMEDEVRIFLKDELKDYADEIMYDNLGSIIFRIGDNKNSKIMLDAHMDEVGFIVKNILNNGKILLKEIGNVSENSKINVRARVTTFNGEKIYGVISGGSSNLYLDLGLNSKKEVEELNIEIGNMVCFATEFIDYKINDVVEGKAMDNRVGCYILMQILKKLKYKKINSSIYFAFTSSEEVGLRGGRTAANLIKPNKAFVIDVVSSKDVFDDTPLNTRKNGKGFLIEVYDKTFIPSKEMINLVKTVAKIENVKYQLDTMNGGGTNAGEIHLQGSGIPSLVTAISIRYCHMAHSMVNMRDIEDLINVYVKLLQKI